MRHRKAAMLEEIGNQMQFANSMKIGAFAAILSATLALPATGTAQFWGRPAFGQPQFMPPVFAQPGNFQKVLGERTARAMGMPIKGVNPDGAYYEVVGMDGHLPLYYITNNIRSADTISTDEVWAGGSAGLSLNGSGVKIGEWDGGHARATHQEFAGGRLTFGDSGSVVNHSTHVAGTIIAAGVNPSAKGMSFGGRLVSYDWNSDTAEMAAAAANGMLVSNHSYGSIAGWTMFEDWYWYGDPNLSATEDFKFGVYNNQARDWDQICFDHPYYLPVKSSGNDRGEGPALADQPTGFYNDGTGWVANDVVRDQDGGTTGYDSIPTAGVGKNIMTVGAVTAIDGGWVDAAGVTMSSFSTWGPTDDGRIKPDIVADGVGLISTTSASDSSYGSSSGTSMSAPSVTGSLALLQQHYRDTHAGEYMRSATLKGLTLHTADEAGAANGPDYKFGWGLMNTRRAVEVISNDVGTPDGITENQLLNGNTFTYGVNALGFEPLKVTISWTDPAGIPGTIANDSPTPKLRNDLDLRITGPGGTAMPWILDPSNPDNPATTGDNFRDNVEQIVIPNPTPGASYTITVTHKGTLVNGGQAFAMILTGGAGAGGGGMVLESASTMMGQYMGGDVTALEDSDNSYYSVRSQTMARIGEYAGVEMTFDNPSGKSNSLNATIEAIATGGTRITGSVFFWNYSTNTWDFIRSYNVPSGGNDAAVTRITRNGDNYVSGSNKVKILFRTHEPIRTYWGFPSRHTLRIDKVTIS